MCSSNWWPENSIADVWLETNLFWPIFRMLEKSRLLLDLLCIFLVLNCINKCWWQVRLELKIDWDLVSETRCDYAHVFDCRLEILHRWQRLTSEGSHIIRMLLQDIFHSMDAAAVTNLVLFLVFVEVIFKLVDLSHVAICFSF